MTFRHIKVFLAVCENNFNVTQAALQLRISQPSVSVALQELEKEYDTPLFDRLGRKLFLTQAGREFWQYARRLEGILDDLEKNLHHPQNSLRIGGSITIGSRFLPSYLEKFRQQFPDTDAKVRIAPSEQLEEMLLKSELDLALLERPAKSPMLLREPYREDSLWVIAPNNGNYSSGQKLTKEELQKERLLLREKGSGSRDLIDKVTQDAGITLSPIWEGISAEALLSGVKKGFGISILPECLVQEAILSGEVVLLKIEGLPFVRTFDLVYHKDKLLTPRMEAFLDLCRTFENVPEQ